MAKDIMVVATITSLEVAEMVEKRHRDLVRDIKKYSKYIEESNNELGVRKNAQSSKEDESLGLVKNDESSEDDLGELNFQPSSEKSNAVKNDVVKDNRLKIESVKNNQRKNARVEDGFIDLDEFWTDSTYLDKKGESRPCYNITKKGCEFIAHKCTGKKGVVFTARYINKFHELEEKANNGTTAMVSKTPAPLTTTFYQKNLYRISIFCKATGMTKKQFIHNFIITIGEKYDINKATAQYILENGSKPRYILELLDYFPEMGETAQNFFDKIYNEYVKEKKEDGSKEV